MAADVSSLTRTLGGRFNEDKMEEMESRSSGGNCSELITRDLLGSCSRTEAKELDLDSQVPTGWEKRLDLKVLVVTLFVRVFASIARSEYQFQRISYWFCSLNRFHLFFGTDFTNTVRIGVPAEMQIFFIVVNVAPPPTPSEPQRVSSGAPRPEPTTNTVVVEDSANHHHHHHRYEKQRSSCSFDGGSSSNSSSSSLTLVKDDEEDRPHQKQRSSPSSPSISCSNSGSLFAAGCSNCLMYVLMSKTNPKCPRCNTFVVVQSAVINKKPRIDLNTFSD